MNEADRFLKKQVEEEKTPSVHYIHFNHESLIHRFNTGWADIRNQHQINEHCTYNAYSVTKTFTALAVLQLAEKGKLEIDDPVNVYLSTFPYGTDISIRQLLTHSAGIPNPIPLSWIHLVSEHAAFDRNHFFDQVFKKNPRTSFMPNEKFQYSNLGYVLLGQLIEKCSGISYEQYILEQILIPLGITPGELGFMIQTNAMHARGYHKRYSLSNAVLSFLINKKKFMGKAEGAWSPFNDFYINGVSYGGLIGTANSFVKYIQELLRPDCKILSDSYKKMLFLENHTNAGKETGMCLSWFSGKLNGNTYFAHAGGGGGYYCELRIYPNLNRGSVVMFNRSGMTDERFLDKVDRFFVAEQ